MWIYRGSKPLDRTTLFNPGEYWVDMIDPGQAWNITRTVIVKLFSFYSFFLYPASASVVWLLVLDTRKGDCPFPRMDELGWATIPPNTYVYLLYAR